MQCDVSDFVGRVGGVFGQHDEMPLTPDELGYGFVPLTINDMDGNK